LLLPRGASARAASTQRDKSSSVSRKLQSVEARAWSSMHLIIGVQYFPDMAALINAPGGPDRAQLAATMRRFGIAPAAPAPEARG
jgi:hypothetical protein